MIIKMMSQVSMLSHEAMSTLTPAITIDTLPILHFIHEMQATQCLNNFRKAAFNDDAAI
jgi:hypothetical protein